MVIPLSQRRPYAAAANLVSVLTRARSRNLPDVINNDFLRIAQVPEVVFGRVNEALGFLKFVNADGTPTDVLRAISAASDAEYRSLLEGAIREAYADDFMNIDPTQDDQSTIVDAFRRYEPRSQTERMVMLFLGLCREAGIAVKDGPRERKPQTSKRSGTKAAKGTGRTSVSASRGARVETTAAPQPAPSMTTGLLFGVTEADIAALGDDDFKTVWDALGKVARARSRPQPVSPEVPEDEPSDEDDE
jgi:hypothetical protein